MNPEPQQEQQKKPGRKRKYSDEFRQQPLERMKSCDNVTALAKELVIRRKWLYEWRSQAGGEVPAAQPRARAKRSEEDRASHRMAQLERMVARQALEIDFFKGALQRVAELAGSSNWAHQTVLAKSGWRLSESEFDELTPKPYRTCGG